MAVIYPTNLPTPMVMPSGTIEGRGSTIGFDSGRMRHRRDWLDSAVTMNLQWNLTEDQFDEFMVFYTQNLQHGARTMSTHLRRFDTVARHSIQFLEPEQLQITHSDNLISVSALILVDPVDPTAPVCNLAIEDDFESYGETELAQGGYYDGGCGWQANWTFVAHPPAFISDETWEDETVGSVDENSVLDGGYGFEISGTSQVAWTVVIHPPKLLANETWEDETVGDALTQDLNGGTGWSSDSGEDAWTTIANNPDNNTMASETFESYAVTANAEAATLNGGSNFSDKWTMLVH